MESIPRPRRRWTLAAALFALGIAVLVVAYHATVASFVDVWRGSGTYTHCFFVLPIAAALIWRRRHALAQVTPRPFLPGLLAILAVGFLWLIAQAAGVLFYEQLAFALLIPALVLTLFGVQVARTITFPLAFILFAVPFGEAFHPALMSYTARATVLGLRLTGIPVAVEGLYITTPTGNWQVVEACSGLRFLISMFTLGTLFAYLHFHQSRTRFLFGLLSLVVPVFANGLRAYVMVLTGYLSRRDIGAGFDHFAIGWTVFAIVMAIFFYIGSRWREAPMAKAAPVPETASPAGGDGSPRGVVVAAAVAFGLALAPAGFAAWAHSESDTGRLTLRSLRAESGWNVVRTPPSSWAPSFQGTEAQNRTVYEKNGALVDYYLGFYRNQTQGRELINFGNVIVPRGDARWRIVAERDTTLGARGTTLPIHETLVRSPSLRYVVWHWYWLPDEFTTSRTRAKLLQARARLLLRRDHASVVILSSPYAGDPSRARARLTDFIEAEFPSIQDAIREADGPR